MANKFTKSLKMMEENSTLANQGSEQNNDNLTTSAIEATKDMNINIEATPPKPSSKNKKTNQTVTLDVGGVIDNLSKKGRKGRSITLYLNNNVMERLEEISQEKNISISKMISAILENALLK
jgi:hypothetical protein